MGFLLLLQRYFFSDLGAWVYLLRFFNRLLDVFVYTYQVLA